MTFPLICHFLIGPPGAGKSTFAAQLATLGNYTIVSTDAIRTQLYGDETIQGSWPDIEQEVLRQIQNSIQNQQGVIYDATNAKRSWRMGLLQQLPSEMCWMAWHLKTSLKQCLQWNQQRTRQVPAIVINQMYQDLQAFPPLPGEGFALVTVLQSPDFDSQSIQNHIATLERSAINRINRTQNETTQFHSYSRLLDFDRLMFLIALFIHSPGLGSGQNSKFIPDEKTITHPEPQAVQEIATAIAIAHGKLYADPVALTQDLAWLQRNGLVHQGLFLNSEPLEQPIEIESRSYQQLQTHPYSDVKPFRRLITAIRLILNHPFLTVPHQKSLQALAQILEQQPGIEGECYHKLRKDIETVLKPFQILPAFPLRHGYFAGTGILSRRELLQIFSLLQAQADSIEDPIALSAYQTLRERMAFSKLITTEVYPVQAIAHRSMVDPELLHPTTLPHQLDSLEPAILQRQQVNLGRLPGRGKFAGDIEGDFQVWPLQIVFYNQAWYLGYEVAADADTGLLRFERLDRLYWGGSQRKTRSEAAQYQALNKLHRLLEASAGLFLGNSVAEQKQFLQAKKSQRKAIEIQIELWFNNAVFPFICEGTRRFSAGSIKMSPPLSGNFATQNTKSLFSLSQTGDDRFPNRFRVIFPRWSLNDVDLIRWIVGFGGQVKVVKPKELVNQIARMGQEIYDIYNATP
jgi:predicted kinase